jgi:hypothetical protein
MSIARLTTTFAFSLLAVQLASGIAAAACPNPDPVELKFKVKADGCVEKVHKKDDTDGTRVSVCEGGTVQWKVSGKPKLIAFVGEPSTNPVPVGTPFEWAASGFEDDGSKIEGKVKAGAANICTKDNPCKYAVYVKDKVCVLDPTIIVDP